MMLRQIEMVKLPCVVALNNIKDLAVGGWRDLVAVGLFLDEVMRKG